MTRSRLLVAMVAVLLALGTWLMSRQNDPTPEPHRSPNPPTIAASPAPASAPWNGPTAPTTTGRAPAPSATPAAPPTPTAANGLSGTVKELNGGGLPDLLVELVDGEDVALLTTTTDEQGEFAFERDHQEATAIITRPAPHGTPRVRHAIPRGPRTSGPGGPGGGRIVLWRPPTSSITGIVVDGAGAPVADAVVTTDRPYMPMGRPSWHVLDGPEPGMSFETKTGDDGRFELPFMMQGRHLLRAERGTQSGSLQASADEAGVVIRLGTHLGGAVVLAGQLTDSLTGAPIAGARVMVQRLRRSAHASSAIGVADATSDAQGRYEVQGLEAGTYRLDTMPAGYAPQATERECADGHHTVDLALLPARNLAVRVVLPDGKPVQGVVVRVRDAAGTTVPVPGELDMLGDGVRTDADGIASLRRLPATQLTLLAVRGDLVPAGRVALDLRGDAPAEVTIDLPTAIARFAREHYFVLCDADGKPATFAGTVVASSFDGDQLLSRVAGSWRGEEFFFGNEQRNGFSGPTIAVGAIAGACRVEIAVPGYQLATLTLAPGEQSPTTVMLQR